MLLIVFFLQYMELASKSDAVTSDASAAQQKLDASRTEIARLEASLAAASQLLDEVGSTMSATRSLLDRQQLESDLRGQQLQSAIDRQRLLGRLMVELFQVPPEAVNSLLDPRRSPPLAETSPEFERLRQRFRDMATASPEEMIQHVLTYEEVRKRCDVWEVHLHADPREVVVTAGDDVKRFPLQLENAEDFAGLDRAAFELACIRT